MKEIIVKGRKYRTLADSVNKIWHRISYWTAASDVQFEDGSYLEGKVFGHCILGREKAYVVGDIAYCTNAPSWVRLRCTQAGQTAATEPAQYKTIATAGTVVTDGTAKFVADDIRLATTLSTSANQAPAVNLLKAIDDKINKAQTDATNAINRGNAINVYVGSDSKLHFKNSAGADSALNFNPHGATYTFPANHTGGTVDLGEIHKYQNINAQNVYNKGVSDGTSKAAANVAKIEYIYHHHTINGTNNDNANASQCPYADNYESTTKGGCFQTPKYHLKYQTSYTQKETVHHECNGDGHSKHWDDGDSCWRCDCSRAVANGDSHTTHDWKSWDTVEDVTHYTNHDYWTTDANDHPGNRTETRYIRSCGKTNGKQMTQTITYK